MPGRGDGSPPLHTNAIQAATERADTYPPALPRIPTRDLEPYQQQRAQALQRAIELLPDAPVTEQIKAAQFIETGHIPDE